MIGIAEALAIDRRLKGKATPRPMTHDLLANVISAMGGSLEKIVINDLRKLDPQDDASGTFIATLHIRRGEDRLTVDSRPSDAIALAVADHTPIFVAEHVLDEATRGPASREERIVLLRRRLDVLRGRIRKLTDRLGDKEFLDQAPPEVIEQHRKLLQELKGEHDAIEEVLRKHG